ncbi:hypothetical protein GCM10017083_06870 [Thalassobaculum fulvum]|uniref:Uncharacterized protein n=1 Tax=Thalassobaculum fulvum TaxID=1633335 RepID=A0A918XNI3_9PROT|nr:hypothetical protein [Thalassobaculum fulvum]GHD42180.1 hypothetical protein GCM10017083_06870 [Thalassobaculum fulvum]
MLFLATTACALPAWGWSDPCEPKEVRLLCGKEPINTAVCEALQADPGGPQAVDKLRAAAVSARAEFALGTRLDASRLVACRLIELAAPADAADVLRASLDAVLATVARTERDEGILSAVVDTALLQAKAGFDLDFGWTLSEFERVAAAYGEPENLVLARGLFGKGLAALGRDDLARDQFQRALPVALALPERDGDRGPRLGNLQTLVQMEAEAGLWDLATAALPPLLAAAAVIDDLPATDRERQGMHRSIAALRDAVERREWPPR